MIQVDEFEWVNVKYITRAFVSKEGEFKIYLWTGTAHVVFNIRGKYVIIVCNNLGLIHHDVAMEMRKRNEKSTD